MLSSPIRCQWVAVTLFCAGLWACPETPIAAPRDDGGIAQGDTLEGTADVLVARHHDRAEVQYYVETDAGLHIRVHFEGDLGIVQPGERLALAGRWNNEKSQSVPTFTATAVLKHLGVDHDQAAGSSANGEVTTAAAGVGTRAPMLHRVAVIMLGTPSYTAQQIRAQVNQTAGSAGSFLTENSDGIDSFEGDVFGPYNVNTSDCANRSYQIADLAKAAAVADGKNLNGYTNIALLLPAGSSCGWGGLGQVGSPGRTGQLLTWYNNSFSCRLVAHELGHNLGMNHSHSTACGTSIYASKRAGCTDIEYGDVFDVMGSADCTGGHFSAPQKQYMRWLDSCQDVTAGGNAVFNLSPIEATCGVRSLRIPIPGETSYYYLEYRKRSAGVFGGAGGLDRVVMSVSNDGATVRPDLYRLDSTPKTSAGHRDGWLALNTSYTLPGNVQVRLLELGEVARVQVTMSQGAGAKCRTGELAPADTSGRIGVGCASDGCPTDPNKTDPGFCGCGIPDTDTDGDGVRDCNDECPTDPNKTKKGVCGCGVSELTCTGFEPGLIRKHYNGQWSTLPNFSELTADAESVVSTINVAGYAAKDNFGLVFTGGVQISTAGTYDFELSSDDGSRLRIDDREVILNDGIHGLIAKTGSISLAAGPHTMRIEFFERDGGETLLLRYRRSGGAFAEIPASLLVHPKATSSDQCPNDPNKTVPGVCGCGVPEGSCGGTPSITTAKATFSVGEPIVVNYANLPGGALDWIGIFTAGSANTAHLQYFYTGKTSGSLTFSAQAEGAYEARLFYNDSYTLVTKVSFRVGVVDECPNDPAKTAPGTCGCGVSDVDSDGDGTANCKDGCASDPSKIVPGLCGCGVPEGSCGPSVKTAKATFSAGEPIVVTYANLPGGATDWIGIYVVGSANTTYLQYLYTGGKTSGSLSFSARAAGNYEARLFFNDSYTLVTKAPFSVTGVTAAP